MTTAGPDQRILEVGDERHRPYGRPWPSKQLPGDGQSAQQGFFPVGDREVLRELGRLAVGSYTPASEVALPRGSRLVGARSSSTRTAPSSAISGSWRQFPLSGSIQEGR